jgi:hypothetical protein
MAAHAPRWVAHLWTPQVDYIARGQVTRTFCPGTDLNGLLADHTLIVDGQAMAAAGPVGGASIPLPLRLVGVQTPPGDGFFRTNLPPQVGPRQGADLDRVRWAVERSMQLDQSVQRLDAIAAAHACSLKTRLHASLMASIITAVLATGTISRLVRSRAARRGQRRRCPRGSSPCRAPCPDKAAPKPSL